MRHAASGFAQAIFLATALRGINGLVHRHNDVCHRDVTGLAGQRVAAAWATGRFDELVATQLAKELLQVRQRNLLPLADGRQRDGTIVLAQSQVNHGGDRKTAFGCETHRKLLV